MAGEEKTKDVEVTEGEEKSHKSDKRKEPTSYKIYRSASNVDEVIYDSTAHPHTIKPGLAVPGDVFPQVHRNRRFMRVTDATEEDIKVCNTVRKHAGFSKAEPSIDRVLRDKKSGKRAE